MSDQAKSYGIRRSDAQWYAGTAGHNPVFTLTPPVASFDNEVAAARRVKGLAEKEQHGRTFAVLPLGGVHAG